MCGIVGIAGLRGAARPDPGLVTRMTDTLAHRGPDASCVVEVGAAGSPGLTFGFRRLSIVDLETGAQPFADESGRIRAICNGEIYNAPELRRDLEARGHRFETRCDTEVIPHLYEESGLDCVTRLNGMFAFAIFDAAAGRLVLGRDRAGEKPLYYLERDGELLFASEIKALLAHPGVGREIDPRALTRYLLYGYVPAPRTPFCGIRKLPAAHLLIAEGGAIRLKRYWDIRRFVGAPGGRLAQGSEETPPGGPIGEEAARDGAIGEEEAARLVRRHLEEAVRLRLRADVPVGIFFSGGVDSSALAALAGEVSGPGVPTFTIGLQDPDFDESPYARRAAAHLGTEHHETRVGEPEMLEGLLAVAGILDEPLADPSLIPTYLLARFARGRVKVALGGEGGDELFAGYPTYLGDRLARVYCLLPSFLRAALRRVIGMIPPAFDNVGTAYLLKRFVAAADRPRRDRHAIWFGIASPERHRDLLSDETLAALGDAGWALDDPLEDARAILEGVRGRDPLDELLLTDFLMFLQDDLLNKMDRASMAVSLEVRAPFLHHPLVECVTAMPARLKLRGLTSKYILKKALADRLTPEIVSRRKRGFTIPISRLMHGGLRPLLLRALDPERVARAGLLRPRAVQALLREHLDRRQDNGRVLYALLMLQLWHARHLGEGDLLQRGDEIVASDSRHHVA